MNYDNLIALIGNTPLIELKTYRKKAIRFFAKLEGNNPGGSVKDRTAKYLIENAEKNGQLKKRKIILEATSGNTGIALAMIAATKGYKFTAVMPDNSSVERIKTLKAFGAEVILTPGEKGTNGAIQFAREMASKFDRYYMPDQFSNPANPQAHFESTGKEIIQDLPDVTALVAGIGTGGTLTGAGKRLKLYNSKIDIIAVEPPSKTRIQGLRNMDEYKPSVYDDLIIDRKLNVADEDAFRLARELYMKEGLAVGISCGAALWGALCYSNTIRRGNIAIIFPDRGERYFSTELFEVFDTEETMNVYSSN